MKYSTMAQLAVAVGLCALGGCKDQAASAKSESNSAEIEAAKAQLARVPADKRDPLRDEIYLYRLSVRPLYNQRQYDELERIAAELRASKATLSNGSWKIVQFYDAFDCDERDAPSMWTLHDEIHREWMAAKPQSVTAKVAYAEFLIDYAWQARGGGFAHTVSDDGWRLFKERLVTARKVLREASQLPEKDPVWGLSALRVARGQGWPKEDFDSLMGEVTAAEPMFWGYDVSRAESLLPRWYGAPGEWETYAEKVVSRPGGAGEETYARIVVMLAPYYDDVFRQSKASWPKTKRGLELLRQRYPESLNWVAQTARFASLAKDRVLAKEMFERLGEDYYVSVWGSRKVYTAARTWTFEK